MLPTLTGLLELVMDQLITYAFTDPRTAARTIDMLSEITISATHAGSLAHLAAPLHTQLQRGRTAVSGSPFDAVIQKDLTEKLAGI